MTCSGCEIILRNMASRKLQLMTFQLSHSPVEIQILSSQSLLSLVDIICKETSVGFKEGVADHMWCVRIGERKYSSTESPELVIISDLHLTTNRKFEFLYDFGSEGGRQHFDGRIS